MKTQKFKIGASIKTIDSKGRERFFTVEMSGGEIYLMEKGVTKFIRQLKTLDNGMQEFIFNGVKYQRNFGGTKMKNTNVMFNHDGNTFKEVFGFSEKEWVETAQKDFEAVDELSNEAIILMLFGIFKNKEYGIVCMALLEAILGRKGDFGRVSNIIEYVLNTVKTKEDRTVLVEALEPIMMNQIKEVLKNEK